jgi:hypothetical protein
MPQTKHEILEEVLQRLDKHHKGLWTNIERMIKERPTSCDDAMMAVLSGINEAKSVVNKMIEELSNPVTPEMKPILGQEAICPDGLGRVTDFSFDMPKTFIEVASYVNNRSCKWDPRNVTLIKLDFLESLHAHNS